MRITVGALPAALPFLFSIADWSFRLRLLALPMGDPASHSEDRTSIAASACRLESSGDEVSAALPPSGRVVLFKSNLELTAMLSQAALSFGLELNHPLCSEQHPAPVPFFPEVPRADHKVVEGTLFCQKLLCCLICSHYPCAPHRCPTVGTSVVPLVPFAQCLKAWLVLTSLSQWVIRAIRLLSSWDRLTFSVLSNSLTNPVILKV